MAEAEKRGKKKVEEVPKIVGKPRRANGFQPGWKKKAEPIEQEPIEREEVFKLPEISLSADGNNIKVERLVLTAELVAVAIYQSRGMLSVAARKLGTTVRTVKAFVANDEICALAMEESNEMLLDFAEAKLFQKIKAGDIASIIFFLRTRGKARGYTEKPSDAESADTKRSLAEQKQDAESRERTFMSKLDEVRERISKAIDIEVFSPEAYDATNGDDGDDNEIVNTES